MRTDAKEEETSKFFLYATGDGKLLVGVTDNGSSTLQELLDFLKQHNIVPSDVSLPASLAVWVKLRK